LKHLDKGSLVLDRLNTLILDEADRMLDMGFHDAIAAIIEKIPAKRQTLLFSATYADEIRQLSTRFQIEPKTVTVDAVHAEAVIEQIFFEVNPKSRTEALIHLLNYYQPSAAVLFCNTKIQCDTVMQELRAKGFYVQAIHGDLEQRDRDQVLVQFANGSCPILVATDVAARGLDIKELPMVINVELAFEADVHIHRVGRTGRAGEYGLALSLVAPSEVTRANAIESAQDTPLTWRAWQELIPEDVDSKKTQRMVTLAISGGRKDKLRPGDILGALTGEAGFAGSQIGKIDLFPLQAFVAVEASIADKALACLQTGKIKGRVFKVRKIGKS
jgi:ATP-independent RNA helicase DbpA